jgi:hypothetical protein
MTSMKEIRELQTMTGAPLQACKQALAAEKDDVKRAANRLRQQGLAPAMAPSVARASDHEKEALRRGYRFDAWEEALSGIVVAEVKKADKLGAVRTIKIEMDDLSLWPMHLTVQGSEARLQTEPFDELFAAFEIPGSKDAQNSVAELFALEHALDPGLFSFYDDFRLPGGVWTMILAELQVGLVEDLVRAGVEVDAGATCQVMIDGDKMDGAAMLVDAVKSYLQEHFGDDDLLRSLAGICYESEARQRWLIDLRDASKPEYPVRLP